MVAAAVYNFNQSPRIGVAPPLPGAGHSSQNGDLRHFSKGDVIFTEGKPAEYFYRVVSGTVQTSNLLVDARRHIDAFHLERDFFGLENASNHSSTAEAVEDCSVRAFRSVSPERLTSQYPTFADQVILSVVDHINRARAHMLLLARRTPQEKLAKFLLDMARRVNKGGDRLKLPMHRADIADHLGLTKETVSRTITQMVKDNLIKLEAAGRTIVLHDRRRLDLLNV